MTERIVVIVGYPGVQSLDLTGPMEVFAGAHRLVGATGRADRGYRVIVAADAPFGTESGLRITPETSPGGVPRRIDTLIVPGGTGVFDVEAPLIEWITVAAGRSRRVASVCSGAFLLARCGLLDGRRATTHWSECARLARDFPAVRVEKDPIYVRDGRVSTSAGVTAGIDLALALVEDDLGHDAALTIARWLVVFLRRPGNQAQFSTHLATQTADREPIREVQHWIAEHLGDDCGIDALAVRARMSPRHFARVFTAGVGVTPGQYVTALRIEAARRRLEESDTPAEAIATACGFGSAETLRRIFHQTLGMAPAEYRRRFRISTGG